MARTKGSLNERLWRDTLRKIACEYAEGNAGPKKVEMVARQIFAAGMNGDIPAAKEIGDRLDGKAMQAIEQTIIDERSVIRAPNPSETSEDWSGEYGPKTVGNA